MLGQKIIESALSTSILIIIWKQYEKLIIHAQGIFSQCVFPKDNFPDDIFPWVSLKARQGYARQEMLGQKIIESASFTSVLYIIRKKYVKLIIYAQGIFSHCAFLKRHFLSNILSLVLMKARHSKARQKMSGQKIIEVSLFTSDAFIIRKNMWSWSFTLKALFLIVHSLKGIFWVTVFL